MGPGKIGRQRLVGENKERQKALKGPFGIAVSLAWAQVKVGVMERAFQVRACCLAWRDLYDEGEEVVFLWSDSLVEKG